MKVLKVKILEAELEAPLLNPKTAAAYDDGMRACIERIQSAQERTENSVEALKEQCNAVIDYIDEVFGVGASRKVLGEETDLLTCFDAFEDMATLYDNQVTPLVSAKVAELNKILLPDGGGDDPA